MKKRYLLFLFYLIPAISLADFISLIKADQCETIIEVFVEENNIRVTFEIGLNDLIYFKELIPAEMLPADMKNLNREKMLWFFANERFIIKADGQVLTGRITRQEVVPRIYRASLYTGVVDSTTNLSKEVLFTEIIYPINGKPATITFTPPIDEDRTSTMANIGFVAYHRGIPVNDLRYLGNTETLHLDWQDPWYTKFENRNLKRHHSSSLLSFLYVEPYEVRHEVLVRVKDLDYWMDLNYKLGDKILIADQAALKDSIAKFLSKHNLVTIDGVTVAPIIDRVHWVKWSLSGMQILAGQQDMDYSSAIIGVIFAYPNDSIAQDVIINWDMWNDRITMVPTIATDPAGPMPYVLQPDDNQLKWKNYLKKYKLPTITEARIIPLSFNLVKSLGIILLIIGLGLTLKTKRKKSYLVMSLIGILIIAGGFFFRLNLDLPYFKKKSFSKPEAAAVISQLLRNTYRAFDFREESDIYDKLAISNEGELLTQVYIQTKQGMVLENQGGLEVKIKEVELLSVEEVDAKEDGIAYQVKWIVKGDVGHWGHIHRRTNQYNAIIDVRPIDGVWKFSNIEIVEEKRL